MGEEETIGQAPINPVPDDLKDQKNKIVSLGDESVWDLLTHEGQEVAAIEAHRLVAIEEKGRSREDNIDVSDIQPREEDDYKNTS